MIGEPRLLTPNLKTKKLQIGLQSAMMTQISHTSCLRREKLNLASKVSTLTTVWYDQMQRRQILYRPRNVSQIVHSTPIDFQKFELSCVREGI